MFRMWSKWNYHTLLEGKCNGVDLGIPCDPDIHSALRDTHKRLITFKVLDGTATGSKRREAQRTHSVEFH